MVGTTQTSQGSLSLPGTHAPRLSPWLWGMLGRLLGSLPPQLHKRLGLAIPLPALQQLQDGVSCEERRSGLGSGGGSAWVVSRRLLPSNRRTSG